MIVFNDVLKRLSDCGWSTYRLQKERQISNGTLSRIRAHKSISTDTLDVICRLCKCQPGDIITYVSDPEEAGE